MSTLLTPPVVNLKESLLVAYPIVHALAVIEPRVLNDTGGLVRRHCAVNQLYMCFNS